METDLLRERVFDTVGICQKTNRPKFLGFLSDEQAVLVGKIIEKLDVDFDLWGGYNDAKRVILGCFPQWDVERDFPITPITFSFRQRDTLAHRDVLGSLMALGLKREAVGDILVEEGRAVVFVTKETAGYVLTQISKIGRVGVSIKEGFCLPLPENGKLMDFSTTVSSNRLDCVISALVGASRSRAAELIEQSFVTVNSDVSEKPTLKINNGDIISVRKKGKFIIDSLDEKTRKDRLILKYKKYV